MPSHPDRVRANYTPGHSVVEWTEDLNPVTQRYSIHWYIDEATVESVRAGSERRELMWRLRRRLARAIEGGH